jgi:hypothetical protein
MVPFQVIGGDRKSLFQSFPVASVADTVKAIFVPISWGLETSTTMVLHHGGRQGGQFAAG